MYQISSQLPEFYRRYYKKTFWCLFFWTECIYRIQHRIVCRGECWYPRRNDYI